VAELTFLVFNFVGALTGRGVSFISLIGGAAASWSSAIVAHSADRTPTMVVMVTTGLQGKK
jgi:hypothetical protein